MIDWEDIAVRWSVRLALGFYVGALAVRLRGGNRNTARSLWTAGYIAFLMHLAAAFHFVHGWSHDAAYEATARRTFEMVGLDWGGGIYGNYAFALIWGMDLLSWWLRPMAYERRPRWVEFSIQAFLGFIAFNSTVVFGAGLIRWAGAIATLVLIAGAVSRRAGPREEPG